MDYIAYSIRPFQPEDVAIYKAIRLEALRLEAGKFGNSHAIESAFPDSEWIDRVTNPDRACFGLFCRGELIGITAAILDATNPHIAYMTQSYIRKEHRGKGLSQMLYNARINWAKQKGVKILTISHRENNERSKAAIIRNGFKPTYTEMRMWGDDTRGFNVYYELRL